MLAQRSRPSSPEESVEGPVKLTVTDERVAGLLGTKRRGSLLLRSFSPSTVRRLIVADSLPKIELPIARTFAQRRSILDLSRSIVTAMLCRQFDLHLFDRLRAVEAVRRWNRRNPRTPIDHGAVVTFDQAAKVRLAHAVAIDRARHEVTLTIRRTLDERRDLGGEERRQLLELSEGLLDSLSAPTWFTLAICLGSPSHGETVRAVSELSLGYLKRFAVADYVAMLLIELLVFLEGAPAAPAEGQGRDGAPLTLVWRVRERRPRAGDRARLQVTISNILGVRRNLGAEIYGRSHLEVKERSLSELYHESQTEGGRAGGASPANLGLSYLSFLKNACAEVDILFDSFVSRLPDSPEDVVNLVFLF